MYLKKTGLHLVSALLPIIGDLSRSPTFESLKIESLSKWSNLLKSPETVITCETEKRDQDSTNRKDQQECYA